LLNTCPHHGFETWRLVSHFYEELTPKDRQMVELMCNGTFEDKDTNEAMEYLDLLAENAQNWDTTGTYEAPSKTQPHTSSGGMYNLREDHELQAKFASLARKVEALELKKSGQLKSIQDIVSQKYFVSTMPWFANIVNFLVSGQLPSHWSTQDKRKFLNEVKNFYWDDPYLFKYCPDQIFRRCIPDNEISSVIKFYHFEVCGGHFS